jgi:hypothetical protein
MMHMPFPIIANGLGGEAIVWLIIAFLWVVAQLVEKAKASRARQQQQPRPSRPVPKQQTASFTPRVAQTQEEDEVESREPRRSFDEEIREFLENIGAEIVGEDKEPPPRPVPTPPQRFPTHATAQTRIALDPSRFSPPAQHIKDTNLGEIEETIKDVDDASVYDVKEYTHSDTTFGSFVDPRTLLVDLSYMRMPLVYIPVTMMSATDSSTSRPPIHGEHDLKRAFKSQIILSTPLAMGEDKSTYTRRIS